MLAAQRQPAAMASGRQPEGEPLSYFGYSVQDEFPLPQNAPLPAGAPLLSDNERSALDDWLQIFMGNAGPMDNNLSLDPVHSENWNDMPPQFVGSTTSFGPSSSRNMQNPFSSNFDLPLMPSPPGAQPLGPVGGSRSNPPSTIPLHNSPGLGHQFSGAAAGNMQGAGAHSHMLSEDVFSAANVLMQNSHSPTSRHASFGYQARPANLAAQYHNSNLMMQNGGQQTLDPSHHHHMSPTTLLQAANHIAGPQMVARHASIATPMGAGANAPLGLHLGGAGSPTARAFPVAADGQATHEPELQWGTDQSFRHKQFIPRSIKETSDAIIHKKLEVMECLEVNPSAATTRQVTPTFELEPDSNGSSAGPFDLKTRAMSFVSNEERAPVLETPDEMAPPRKKRKSKSAASSKGMPVAGDADHDEDAIDGNGEHANGNGDNDDEDTANGALTKSGKPRKRKTKAAAAQSLKSSASPPNLESIPERSVSQDGNDSSGAQASGTPTSASASASATKRRRSTQAKPPRENLTEEQKRENHIKSEQKRRTLIKNGFEDLGILVPGLVGGSHSKSTMLMIAANYLEDLLKGNKQLREQAMKL